MLLLVHPAERQLAKRGKGQMANRGTRPLLLWIVLLIACAILVFITFPGVSERIIGR